MSRLALPTQEGLPGPRRILPTPRCHTVVLNCSELFLLGISFHFDRFIQKAIGYDGAGHLQQGTAFRARYVEVVNLQNTIQLAQTVKKGSQRMVSCRPDQGE